jgi:hypothetical protein
MSEPVKKTGGNLKGPGPGRPKGMPNKTTALLKDAILRAAEAAGGNEGMIGYLTTQAAENPGPFMSLLGKVLPMQVTGEDGGAVRIEVVKRVIVDPTGNPDGEGVPPAA